MQSDIGLEPLRGFFCLVDVNRCIAGCADATRIQGEAWIVSGYVHCKLLLNWYSQSVQTHEWYLPFFLLTRIAVGVHDPERPRSIVSISTAGDVVFITIASKRLMVANSPSLLW